jgi:hypothetical protein
MASNDLRPQFKVSVMAAGGRRIWRHTHDARQKQVKGTATIKKIKREEVNWSEER